MSGEPELLVDRDGAVVTLELNRPAHRNALSNDLLEGLGAELQRHDADPSVRCIVLRGSDKVFASGADLTVLQNADEDAMQRRFRAWVATRAIGTPTIAAVSGFCLGGGCELALSCDLVVASATARFGLPETSLGLIPAAGGTQRLPRIVGRALAMDMILAGRVLDAQEALAAGLVSRVLAPDDWRTEAAELAAAVAARGPRAQAAAKRVAAAAHELPLADGLELERRAFLDALASDEAREGIAAFLEKRPPRWT